VYRGLQDTATPFYATLAANALNVVLGWAFIFGLGLGVKGAAAATVTAQVSASQESRLTPALPTQRWQVCMP
jgi:Na+-driven multidrug efflux pump